MHKLTYVGVLLSGHGNVDDEPQDHTRSQLIERLDVEGADPRIKLSADKPLSRRERVSSIGWSKTNIVEAVLCVSALSEHLLLAIACKLHIACLNDLQTLTSEPVGHVPGI